MSFHRWLRDLRSALAPAQRPRKHARRGSKRAPTHRPGLEVLEDRCVPAFVAPVDYTVGDAPIDMKAGDFNHDGRLDFVTANRDDATISVLLGDPDGTFQPARTSVTFIYPASLAVGDFNQDGKLDLAMDDGNGDLGILLGHGDGTFAPPVVSRLELAYDSVVTSVATGDLNADGKLDVVASLRDDYGYLGTFVNVLLGHGDGSFEQVATYGPQYLGNSFDSLVLADFDGDGDDDMVASWSMIYLSNGDGTLQEPRSVGGSGDTLTIADFDADEKLDLATSSTFSSGRVLRGNGDGTFQPAQSFAARFHRGSVNAADVSGDGVLDLAGIEGVDLTVLLGNSDGSFGPPISTARVFGATSLVVTDFNADGRPDAAVSYLTSDTVSVLFNDGNWSPDDPSVSIGNATVTEGNTGTVNATFMVTLSHASAVPVTVHYATADGSAAAGSDYTAASRDVIIPAGQTSATVTVAVRGDRLPEPTETFAINLTAATGATIGDGQGIGTILDNEPRISIGDVTKEEGKKGKTTSLTFTVTLSVPYDQPVTVSFQTVNGTATTGDGDYVARTGTLTFAPGQTTKTITIEVKGDSKREADETFYLDLFGNSSNAGFSKSRGIGTILNDD